MKKLNFNFKYISVLIYIILFIIIGYYSVEPKNIPITKNFYREDISLIYLFIFNYSNLILLIVISFLGGIFSIFSITNLLIKTGIILHTIKLNTKMSIFNIISITMIHGIFEFLAIGIVLKISFDLFLTFFKALILGSNINLLQFIKYYIKNNLYNKIICITILLVIAAILEYFVSAQLFLKLRITLK